MKHDTKPIRELIEIYKQVKRNTIYGLYLNGLSLREISRRLGGSTAPVVKKILDKIREESIRKGNEI
jgi:transposase-like protein